jgi:hypothetical protein
LTPRSRACASMASIEIAIVMCVMCYAAREGGGERAAARVVRSKKTLAKARLASSRFSPSLIYILVQAIPRPES